jgi:hypothetical protein
VQNLLNFLLKSLQELPLDFRGPGGRSTLAKCGWHHVHISASLTKRNKTSYLFSLLFFVPAQHKLMRSMKQAGKPPMIHFQGRNSIKRL